MENALDVVDMATNVMEGIDDFSLDVNMLDELSDNVKVLESDIGETMVKLEETPMFQDIMTFMEEEE